jgi:tRNA threonylcarbamoyladenosine biosynthesis protein TsaB
MLILAVDTSGRQGSVALARYDARGFELIESAPVAGGTFSAQLVPVIAAMLARHNLPKEKLDAFVAASGPGSFTGLRVGLAAVKGLAETLCKPIAAVSVLEACAHAQHEKTEGGEILVALDASRGDIFLGRFVFDKTEKRLHCLEESLVGREEFVQFARENASHTVCSPDQTVIEFLGAHGLAIQRIERPGSVEIAQIGAQKIAAGDIVTPEALDANYIRRAEFTRIGAR